MKKTPPLTLTQWLQIALYFLEVEAEACAHRMPIISADDSTSKH